MPSAYTASQKAAIAQFVGFTSAKDSVAAKVSSAAFDGTRYDTSMAWKPLQWWLLVRKEKEH